MRSLQPAPLLNGVVPLTKGLVLMPISKSVGKGGSNLRREVRYVQNLLNAWRQQHGRPKIKVDGVLGPETIGAIEDFQRAVTRVVDGRVDPNGPSIKALEAGIEPLARELEAYGVLALALSYDPNVDRPVLDSRYLEQILRPPFGPESR
jgi:peptidoglycan hydrolase-like protein with peptidoglycan-binding domain